MSADPGGKGPLFKAAVAAAVRLEDAVAAAVTTSHRFAGLEEKIAKTVKTSQQLRAYVLRMGLASALADLSGLVQQVKTSLLEEAAAIRKQDPRTVPVITAAARAEHRAALLAEIKNA